MSRSNEQAYVSKADRVNHTRAGRRRKKRRSEAVMIGGIILFVCVVALLGTGMLLKIADIRVENPDVIYSNAEIIQASGIKREESLLRVNKKSVAAKICRTLPYVGEAVIGVSLPDTVTITVTYTSASLAVSGPAGYTLLDSTGKVLQTAVPLLPEKAALLSGVTLTSAVPGERAEFEGENTLDEVTGLALAFEENGISGVTGLDLTDPSNVVAEINSNTDIRLGAISKAAGKLAFGKEVIDRTLSQARSTSSKLVIDLTVENSAFVRSQDDIDAAVSARDAAEALTDENGLPVETTAPAEGETGAEEPAGEQNGAEETEPKGSVG